MNPVEYYIALIELYTKAQRRLLGIYCVGLDSLISDEAEPGDLEREIAYLIKTGREQQLVKSLDFVDAVSAL